MGTTVFLVNLKNEVIHHGKDMELFVIYKISPHPSLPKRG
jgi:hypothetical protein